VRDPRIRATVEFFGPTDFFGTFVRDVVEDALRGQLRPLPGLSHLNTTWLQPLRRGVVTYEATRLALLRRSPAWFVTRLGPVKLHHGTADDVVDVSQAQRLIDAMSGIGRGPPDFEAYLYADVGHSAFAMTGAAARVTAFLGRLRVPLGGESRQTSEELAVRGRATTQCCSGQIMNRARRPFSRVSPPSPSRLARAATHAS
jgi:hypothetical protein